MPAPRGKSVGDIITGRTGVKRVVKSHEHLLAITGNASKYDEDWAMRIAYQYATDSRSLRNLCLEVDQFPGIATIYHWKNVHPEFEQAWQVAKIVRSHMLADECQHIADDLDVDNQYGLARVARAKLMIGVRQHQSKVLNPADFSPSLKLGGTIGIASFVDLVKAASAAEEEKAEAETVDV